MNSTQYHYAMNYFALSNNKHPIKSNILEFACMQILLLLFISFANNHIITIKLEIFDNAKYQFSILRKFNFCGRFEIQSRQLSNCIFKIKIFPVNFESAEFFDFIRQFEESRDIKHLLLCPNFMGHLKSSIS